MNNKKDITPKNTAQANRNPNNKDSIAYRLNYAIMKRRYTGKEVSQKTEDKENGIKAIHPATISLYINGKSVPNQMNIERLAEVLMVDPAWLSGFLPFEQMDRPNRNNKGAKELLDIYERLDDERKEYLLKTARMTLVTMNSTPNN